MNLRPAVEAWIDLVNVNLRMELQTLSLQKAEISMRDPPKKTYIPHLEKQATTLFLVPRS